MKSENRAWKVSLGAAAVFACCGLAGAQVVQSTGPDVIVGDLPDISNNGASGLYDSVAVGTTSCNRGNTPLNWFTGGTDNRHPAISQNVYRYMNGRFEQMGEGWLKHGFTALQGSVCNSYFGTALGANPPGTPMGCSATGGTTLGIGCSDPYSSGLNNGGANGMGPKWQVNAATGLFPYPYAGSSMSAAPRIRLADLNQGVQAGARWFIEGQYVAGDDAAAVTNNPFTRVPAVAPYQNKNNNASWREISWTAATGTVPNATNFTASLTSGQVVHREQPAIYAWQAIDPTVVISTFDVPSDGRFILACKVSGTGPYTYEYALHNLNSHRCGGSFIVPLPGTQAALTGVGYHDVEAVGEPNGPTSETSMPDASSNDWALSGGDAGSTSVSWSGPSYAGTPPVYTMDPVVQYKVASFTPGTGNDHSANVIRWGTMSNFRFTSEVAPASTGSVAAGLFRPGPGSAIVFTNIPTPGGATVGTFTATCCVGGACSVAAQADCTGSWGLPGTTCTPDPCALGACCNTGVCSISLNAACDGAWTVGGACDPNPCPPPSGACCANNVCTVIAASECSSNYLGHNSSCTGAPCPQANNPCSGAFWIAAGVPVTGSTAVATADGTASCGSSAATADVWYKYKPQTAATVGFNLCGSSYDTVVSVHTGVCGALTQVACNDDNASGNNACGGGLSSGVNYTVSAGAVAAETVYYIRVSGYNGSTGTYTLTVVGGGGVIPPTGPANDNCSDATAVATGANPFSTIGATTDGPTHAACNFNASNQITSDVWFTHTAAGNGGLKIDTCAGAGFDTKIAVYSGSACNVTDARLLGCNDDASCSPGRSVVSIPVTSGQSYLIRVGSAAGATGAGTLSLTACRADFNGDGIADVQDIFDYLNGWLAGSPRADFNLTGGVTVDDIFDMINGWFGGC
ncbi:MAG TPA: GC-type dockerin domain-anchored protein [Phycisphaerales bacterium]|nr:GC-type dockerin domain-anchored protein [Phycisphaerales bacterium]